MYSRRAICCGTRRAAIVWAMTCGSCFDAIMVQRNARVSGKGHRTDRETVIRRVLAGKSRSTDMVEEVLVWAV